MVYTKTTWVPNTTPVTAALMNHIEDGIGTVDSGKVDSDSVVVAATRIVASKLLSGDTQPAFRIFGDGKHEWGPGGATATDTNLYRISAGNLRTDTIFTAGNSIYSSPAGSGVGFVYNPVSGGGAAFYSAVAGEANARFRFSTEGHLDWGPGGAIGTDTDLYREAANLLATDDSFHIMTGQTLVMNNGSPTSGSTIPQQIEFAYFGSNRQYRHWIGTQHDASSDAGNRMDFNLWNLSATDANALGPVRVLRLDGSGKLIIGNATDTNLYRAAAGILKTDSRLDVVGSLVVDGAGTGQALYFGYANDAVLYRSGALYLKTDGNFQAVLDIAARLGAAQQIVLGGSGAAAGIYFGSGADAKITRNNPQDLATDGVWRVGSSLVVDAAGSGTPATQKIYFGAALDTTLYRQQASGLKTDGAFFARDAVVVDHGGGGSALYFGSALDTNLYRSASNSLRTAGSFHADSAIVVDEAGVGNGLYFGSLYDTSLYRSAANQLMTAASLVVNYLDIRQAGANGVGIYVSALASSGVVLAAHQAGDTTGWRFQVNADGKTWWGTGGTAAPDTNLYRAAAGVLKTDGAIASMGYGTSLPASPVDGQEYTLVDSTTNPTYQWRFRYNASSSSAYKWEFIGGAPAYAGQSSTVSMPTESTWYDCNTKITVPRAGDYVVHWQLALNVTTAPTSGYLIGVGKGANPGTNYRWYNPGPPTGKHGALVGDWKHLAVAASTVLGVWCDPQGGTISVVAEAGDIFVTPVRVS